MAIIIIYKGSFVSRIRQTVACCQWADQPCPATPPRPPLPALPPLPLPALAPPRLVAALADRLGAGRRVLDLARSQAGGLQVGFGVARMNG